MIQDLLHRARHTPKTAAEVLGISTRMVIKYIQSGALKADNISNGLKRARWIIQRADLVTFIRIRSTR